MKCLTTLSLNQNELDMFDCRHLVAINSISVDQNRLGPFIHEYKVETLTIISAENQESLESL
jgi:hypothetical protein